jgi:hypothetical protein
VRAALLASLFLVALGCADEVVPTTQIVIVVAAETSLEPEIARIEILGHRANGMTVRQELKIDAQNPLPLSFSLVPGVDAPEATLDLRVLAATGEILGERSLRLPFATRRTLGYGVLFSARCRALLGLCESEDQTCADCACGPVEVPPEDLTHLRHADQVFEAWLPRLSCEPREDAGTYDASPEGHENDTFSAET